MALERGVVYLAVVLDLYSRRVRGFALSRSLGDELSLEALDLALAGGRPVIHHSDRGVQYCSKDYVGRLAEEGVMISMARVGCPQDNAQVERWMRTLKEEEVYLSEYRDFADAYASIGHFIEAVYNHKRIHSALGYLTPVEYEAAYWATVNQTREQVPVPA